MPDPHEYIRDFLYRRDLDRARMAATPTRQPLPETPTGRATDGRDATLSPSGGQSRPSFSQETE
jgi:hypothetical protein